MTTNERQDFSFTGSDGLQIACYRWPHVGRAKGVLQICHTFGSYALRLARLATIMSGAGFEVYANDLRGCGRTAKDLRTLGDFGGGEGWNATATDVARLTEIAGSRNPGVPLILLGEGTGSLLVQQFLLDHSQLLDGAVLCGSTALDQIEAAFKTGELESLNRDFEPARTPYDWLSRDSTAVDAFVNDPLCGLGLGEAALEAILRAAPRLADPNKLARIRSTLPIYIIAGDQDPFNNHLKWIKVLADRYRAAGVADVTERYYPGGRHAMFHDVNGDEVINDVLNWCLRICDLKIASRG